MRLQSSLIQFINKLFLAPNDIPVIAFGPLISFPFEGIVDTVREIGFEFYFRSAL